jgi:cell division transport system permease protein
MLVGSMAFLAALALAGVVAASALGEHWQHGAAATLTVQVPDPGESGRLDHVLAALRATAGVEEARALDDKEIEALLRPWLGSGAGRIALPLPAVIAVRLDRPLDTQALGARLQAEAEGTLVEANDTWIRRLSVLARSLQACAALAMAVVGFVAVAVVTVATRAGLSARRDAIEIVHGLGATDGFIAGRFARRATSLAGSGGLVGALLALPMLLGLTGLAAPFSGGDAPDGLAALARAMPATLWLGLPALPVVAAAIGWITAQATVRRWLRRLP